MSVVFSRRADKHGVPRSSAWYVMMTAEGTPFTTNWGEAGTWYEGTDDRGVALEVGAVWRGSNEMVVHAMPLGHRHTATEG
ncbi:MAG: hypothetical protein LBL01_08010 [Bifidobacteriaceae bacterium]|jgi:hypothetical protein|nr:hypothetical protein [Bifidobacteriaceae bacterium]